MSDDGKAKGATTKTGPASPAPDAVPEASADVEAAKREIRQLRRRIRNQEQQIELLEGERKKLAAVVGYADAGFLLVGRQLNVTWCNEVARDWYKHRDISKRLGQLPCHELLCESEQPCTDCPTAAALSSGSVCHHELQIDFGAGSRHIYTTAMPIRSADGQTESSLVMLQDVTDLNILRDSETALQKAKNLAEAASRAKGEFLANMSHEIRTPMNGVVGMAELLLETSLEPRQHEYASAIQRSASSLLTVINDILDFSKIEANELTIEPISFDLPTAVGDVVELFAEQAAKKAVELIVRIGSGVPRGVVGDPGRIRQVLVNLVGNAVKFTAAGHVLIDLQPLAPGSGICRVGITVEDTGIGIPADKLDTVFQKFTQVDASTTRKHGGSGLGLAISKQLVELMGGTIRAESTPELGSKFWIELPLAVAGPEAQDERQSQNLDGIEVLVVHPHGLVREVLCEQIERWGARPHGVMGMDDALKELRTGRFALAAVGQDLAGDDSMDLARRIRETPGLQSLPLVLFTSVGQAGDAKQAQNAGYGGYLSCVYRPRVMRDMFLSLLGEKPMEAPRQLLTRHSVVEARIRQLRGQDLDHAPFEGVRVLVAEDNRVNQRVAQRMLECLGCEVSIVENGQEALDRLAVQQYALTLMDVQMPIMDGLEATRRIRSGAVAGVEPTLCIVAMTANAMAGDREQCIEAGMDDYISKPIRKADLISVMAQILERVGR